MDYEFVSFRSLSDDIPELFNEHKEMFGYDLVISIFSDITHYPADKIIESLKDAGSAWVNDSPPEYDVTFVVIKAIS